MARPGVTYTEVANAASQLHNNNQSPTIERVRIILGTGSSTTISNHLKKWKESQDAVGQISLRENLPQELIALLKNLWDQVILQSDESINAIKLENQQIITELQTDIEKYKNNNQRWQKLHDGWLVNKTQLTNDKITLEQALEFSQKENTALNSKVDAQVKQLQDKQERIDELNRLHKQTQENLEHYRESTREQRLLDQQQHEEQKQQLQSEIKKSNEQLVFLRENIALLQQKHQTLSQSYTALDKDHAQTLVEQQQLTAEIQKIEKVKNDYLASSQHYQKGYEELQKDINNSNNALLLAQSETKLLSQKLMDAQQMLASLQDQNRLLDHDKWALAQEKSQLEGQLKQMQKTVNA